MSEQSDKQGSLTAFLESEGISHFTGLEVVTLRRSGVVAEVPPESWWPRIIPALNIAELIRAELGHGLIIGNGYRPEALNKVAKGAKNSQHIHFRALDLDLPSPHKTRDHQEELYEAAARAYLEFGVDMKVGFGIYHPRRGKRVHIDCGFRRRVWGGPKNWRGKPTKAWVNALLDSLR